MSPPPSGTELVDSSEAVEDPAPSAPAPGAIRGGRLAGKSLPVAILILALPVLLEQFANALVQLVDKALAGHLPGDMATPALDGVGIAGYLSWFISVAMAAIGIGGMALIARAIGAGDRDLAQRTLGQSVLFAIAWGFVVGIVLWFIARPLASLANLSEEATLYCLQYTRILALGMPLIGFLFVSINCLHGAGETTRPFLIMVVVNVVNILASWILSGVSIPLPAIGVVIENPFSFDLHVVGIALGTVIGKAVGAVLIALLMLRGVHDLRLELPALRPNWEIFRRVVRIGLPSFLDGFGMWAGQLIAVFWLLGIIVEKTGQTEGLLGAHIITVQWEAFSFMPGFALGVAAGALAGQYLGADNPRMATRAIAACTVLGMILMGLAGLVFIFAGEFLTYLISRQPIHLELAPQLLMICGFVQVFFAMAMVIRGGLRGAGDTTASMLLTWVTTWGVRIPLAWYFGVVFRDGELGLVGMWIGLCAELGVRGLAFLARFLHGGWRTVQV
ncbi:MAG: MATE family efflux transporter [Phycisphaerales bacterium]